MEEKLDEIIALLTQLPDTLHSFITAQSEPLPDPDPEPEEEPKADPHPEPEEDDDKDLGMDYLEF